MNPINVRLMFQSLKLRPGMGRSVQASVLTLVLTTASLSPAQSQPLTWQNALAKLFGRQPQKGVSRGTPFCGVTPMSYRTMPSPQGRVFNATSQRLLTDKPLIVWYGNVSSVKIRNRTTKAEQIVSLPPSVIEDSTQDGKKAPSPIVAYQAQYEGEPLLPDQEYELLFMSPRDPKAKRDIVSTMESYRFRTVSQADRNRLNRQLRDLATNAAGTNSDPILSQVEFLLQQNLVNDAHMLILQQSNPSPELAAAISNARNPCEVKLDLKASPAPRPSSSPAPKP